MGRKIIITKEIALKAVLFGACRIPKVGEDIGRLSQSDLVLAEKILTKNEKDKLKIPLFVMSSGDGSGSGYG